MFTSKLLINGDVGSAPINASISRSAEGNIGQDVTLNAAKSGTLTTRTSDTAGTLTLETGHGIQTADVADVYWDGGRRYGVTVGTVAGDNVPIASGAGDVLPAQDTAVTIAVQQEIVIQFDADLLKMIAVQCDRRARVQFYAGATLELGLDIIAGEPWLWWDNSTAANPMAGDDITKVMATTGETSDATLRIGALYDSA